MIFNETENNKRCSRCGDVKPLDEFHRQKTGKKGRHSWCKLCFNAYHIVHRGGTSESKQRQNYKRRYGITPETVRQMIAEQNNQCPICGVKLMNQYRVDHDHKNGGVRGILCHRCNLLIAGVDDADFLDKALVYLARYQ